MMKSGPKSVLRHAYRKTKISQIPNPKKTWYEIPKRHDMRRIYDDMRWDIWMILYDAMRWYMNDIIYDTIWYDMIYSV